MSIHIDTTTLGAVSARHSVVTDPLRALLRTHGPDARCEVTWAVYPFGTYMTHVRVLPDHVCWTDDTLCHECGGAA